jgi:hypothetical protein
MFVITENILKRPVFNVFCQVDCEGVASSIANFPLCTGILYLMTLKWTTEIFRMMMVVVVVMMMINERMKLCVVFVWFLLLMSSWHKEMSPEIHTYIYCKFYVQTVGLIIRNLQIYKLPNFVVEWVSLLPPIRKE